MKRIVLYAGLSALIVLAAVLIGFLLPMPSSNPSLDESQAVEAAKGFLLNCPTFRFDGIKDSIMIDKVVQVQFGWDMIINFRCAHSGYGDRSGEYLLEVETPHQIRVTVERGEVSSAIIDDVWNEFAQSYLYTEERAVETAKEFLLNCPTFKFDGISESVKVVKAYTMRCPWTWMVELSFTCRHSGYGNRTGLILLQVLTDHEMSVVVQKGTVISAIIDDIWDEINQRFIGEDNKLLLMVTTDKVVYHEGDNMTITIRNASNQTITFGSTAYGVVFEKWEKDKWIFHSSIYGPEVLVSLEPGQIKQITVKLSNMDQPFTSGKYRGLSSGWIEQDGHHIEIWGYSEFVIE